MRKYQKKMNDVLHKSTSKMQVMKVQKRKVQEVQKGKKKSSTLKKT